MEKWIQILAVPSCSLPARLSHDSFTQPSTVSLTLLLPSAFSGPQRALRTPIDVSAIARVLGVFTGNSISKPVATRELTIRIHHGQTTAASTCILVSLSFPTVEALAYDYGYLLTFPSWQRNLYSVLHLQTIRAIQ